MGRIWSWIKGEAVLSAAWLLAVVSAIAVPPDGGYLDYVDFHTLGLLFALMAVMAGLQGLGLFRRLGEALLARTATTRQLEGALIFLPFFASMAVTNDVALITFVPYALEVLRLAGEEGRVLPVVTMQTIAANLGSMTTPIGNPQNLYLYSRYQMSAGTFFAAMAPLSAGALVLLLIFLLVRKSRPLSLALQADPSATPPMARGKLLLYLALFLLCLASVAKVLSLWILVPVVLVAVLAVDRTVLRRVDYSLLLTFVGFFLFVGNLGRLPAVTGFFQSILDGHEVLCGVAASQIISNVPAALLLSGFTQRGEALLVGVNLGGLGTLIASMASLISYKYVARTYPRLRARYLGWFTTANVVFLVLLLLLWRVLP